ncbi:MAG: UDP-N-acetylmuramoyl-L-alanine--D-glutamate ligase [Tissierellia bacterium]|nr:UDP-N-acetylmuramoyl-L-alanine--D-glutamate ligase [Tissierellia bacterium]
MKKNILVMGLGTTGQSALKALKGQGVKLFAYDDQGERQKDLEEGVSWYKEEDPVDLVVKSPGIKLDHPLLKSLREKDISIISDIELAYRLSKSKYFLAVTGTNGKTTVASLLHRVIVEGGKKAYLVGNIGVGILGPALEAEEEDILVVEASSFQLETTERFKPYISIITNLSVDHLDHHGSLEAYHQAKKKIYANQTEEDLLILNREDPISRDLEVKGPQVLRIGLEADPDLAAYYAQGKLWYNLGGGPQALMEAKDLKVLGLHNIQNLLQVLLAALYLGIDPQSIRQTFRDFKGVEHRIEYLISHGGVRVYNDSKGTNPDSTEIAVKSMPCPVHLLAGGYDKGSQFEPMFLAIKDKIEGLYLYGETKDILKAAAQEAGIESIYVFSNLEEATRAAMKRAKSGQAILLSPACASWDQYPNFEVRGQAFKDLILGQWGRRFDEKESK